MYCAYLKQADGGWLRTTELEDILDHEGEIVEVQKQDDEKAAVAEIRATSPEPLNDDGKGNLFTSEYRIEDGFRGRWNGRNYSNLESSDFDHGAKIVIKDRRAFVLVHMDGRKLITDRPGFEDVVGVQTEQGFVLCERKPVLAKLLHDKRNNKRNRNHRKKKQSRHVTQDVLKGATYQLQKLSDVSPDTRKWTLPTFFLAILGNDHVNGEESSNEVLDELAGYWLLDSEKNELFHNTVSEHVENDKGQKEWIKKPGNVGKLVTKRLGFREARELEEF